MKTTKLALIVPCYNEENRLPVDRYNHFLNHNDNTLLLFVNDGSSDNTIEVLNHLQQRYLDKVTVLDLPQNVGKAEAVRQGVNLLLKTSDIQSIGYMDADLSTDFDEMLRLYSISEDYRYQELIVFGSRQTSVNDGIKKSPLRHLLGRVVAMFTKRIHGLNIYDTQCGAKVFSRGIASVCFKEEFLSRWLFDVEMFVRIRQYYQRANAQMHIKEVALTNWVHQEGSKITLNDSLKIPLQLQHINMRYNVLPKLDMMFNNLVSGLSSLQPN